MDKKLVFKDVLSNGVSTGLKNFLSLIGCVVLWLITIWIPYINVGTTIAIITLPAALSKGTVISPLEIFNKRYFRYMGEFFLVEGLAGIIIFSAMLFMFFPAIVMSIAYCFAALLVVDKGKGASEALKLSNRATYGNKWTIFFVQLVLAILIPILGLIWKPLVVIYLIFYIPVSLGVMAIMYKELTSDISEE